MRMNLKIKRIAAGCTFKKLSEKTGLTGQALFNVEAGLTWGEGKTWLKIQKALNIPDAEMWGIMKEGFDEDMTKGKE